MRVLFNRLRFRVTVTVQVKSRVRIRGRSRIRIRVSAHEVNGPFGLGLSVRSLKFGLKSE